MIMSCFHLEPLSHILISKPDLILNPVFDKLTLKSFWNKQENQKYVSSCVMKTNQIKLLGTIKLLL